MALVRWIVGSVGIVVVVMSVFTFAQQSPSGDEQIVRETDTVDEAFVAALRDADVTMARTLLLDNQALYGPRDGLHALRVAIRGNDVLSAECHTIAHALGHAAYEQYGSFETAMQYQDEVCNSGYIHGIIEEYFYTQENIHDVLSSICGNVIGTAFLRWQCFHGVGHGVMYYTDNELPESLALCESLPDTSAIMSCVNGALMENFTAVGEHVSAYLSEVNPAFPCATLANDYQSDCYFYAPTYYLALHPQQYDEALAWCGTLTPPFTTICVMGVGSQAMKEHMNTPRLVADMCHRSPLFSYACIEGLSGMLTFFLGSPDQAREVCDQLDHVDATVCRAITADRAAMFK